MADTSGAATLRTEAAPFGRTDGGGPEVSSFNLDNGLEVVVVPDRRVPVVTHMVWYRNGSADDPVGQSGIAHFLEHLMFKGTSRHPAGEFSQVVSALGGQENAFTSYDYTAYFQRVAREHLRTMMEFEADRMTGLVLDEAVVAPERDLALAYYRRFYTPENAILVVAGDVEPDEVRRVADATYGRVTPFGERPVRRRPREPDPRAARHIEVADPKVEQPTLQRLYLTPSSRTAQGRDSQALELLAEVLGGGPTSYLYRKLVMERGVAVNAGAWYMGSSIDDTRFSIYAVPSQGVSLEALEEAVDAAVKTVPAEAFDDAAVERAKTRLVAETIYSTDSQSSLARIYGSALAIGETIEEVRRWPDEIEAVTTPALASVTERFLIPRRAVTGYLCKTDEGQSG